MRDLRIICPQTIIPILGDEMSDRDSTADEIRERHSQLFQRWQNGEHTLEEAFAEASLAELAASEGLCSFDLG